MRITSAALQACLNLTVSPVPSRKRRTAPTLLRLHGHYAPNTSVGRPEIQAFVGSLVGLGASKGVFVTTSTFSNPATEFVRGLQQRIILIDGSRLTELMVEFGVGVRLSRTVEFKRLDEDFFAGDE